MSASANSVNATGDARPDNVDSREAAHYAALADTWWDRSGPFWPLHRLNGLRTRWLRDVLTGAFGRSAGDPQPLHDLRVLDVGCGGGILSESMAALGADVHGVDVVEKNIAVARTHARETGMDICYETVDTATLCQRDTRFDVVLNMEVVEHVPDVEALMRDCMRLLRPGGVLVVATINRTLLSWLCAIVGAEYVMRWLPRGTHRWRRFVTPGELDALIDAEGLTPLTRTGVRVNPVTRKFSLTARMAVNYMIVARRDKTSEEKVVNRSEASRRSDETTEKSS